MSRDGECEAAYQRDREAQRWMDSLHEGWNSESGARDGDIRVVATEARMRSVHACTPRRLEPLQTSTLCERSKEVS